MHLQTNESTGYRPRAWLWLAGLFLAGFGAFAALGGLMLFTS